jgi:enoyl-CoA hydratase
MASDKTYECFDVELADGIAHLRMNRPEAYNSMIAAFWRELPEIVDGISRDGSARAIVLSSTGKHFCAGMDLAVFTSDTGDADAELGRKQARLRGTVKTLQRTASCLEEARMPVLVAVQGGCIGGALDLATAADLRYCSADAFFVVQEINIGMTADIGTLQRLGKCVPEGVARELAYTGRRMPAQRAYEVGLVQQVYPDHEALVDGVLETAREIASKSPLAVHGTKVSMNYARDHSVAESLDQIATWQSGMFQPGDMIESFSAKAEKREAKYPDLLPERSSL